MTRIFISYRRDDSAGHVDLLRQILIQWFGADEIFHDINTIPPGVDFVKAIEEAVVSSDVLLVVIGQRWLTATDSRGQRRLENPADIVRNEIIAALDRKIRVIPVLVQDAHMPRLDELPQALAPLAQRNALQLRDASWDYDVGRLTAVLESHIQSATQVGYRVQQPVQQPRPSSHQLLTRIILDPTVMTGKPVIKGTRLTVEYILNLFAHGATNEEILEEYPNLSLEDIQACFLFATKALESTSFMPLRGEAA